MTSRPVTPKSMVLDMLRVTPGRRAVPISGLVALGAVFDFSGNAVRVAVTRLVGGGIVDSVGRGDYRLARHADPLKHLVDDWRLGEDRVRAWKGRWLAVWHPPGGARTERRRSQRAMTLLGFRAGLDGLSVRPDNLSIRRPALLTRLQSLGLTGRAELVSADGFSPQTTARWHNELWPVQELQADYRSIIEDLTRSSKRVRSLPRKRALVETFLLGGAAIRALALDPLLPDEICSSVPRRALTCAMTRYDELGRSIWAEMIGDATLLAAPSHLSAQGAPANA